MPGADFKSIAPMPHRSHGWAPDGVGSVVRIIMKARRRLDAERTVDRFASPQGRMRRPGSSVDAKLPEPTIRPAAMSLAATDVLAGERPGRSDATEDQATPAELRTAGAASPRGRAQACRGWSGPRRRCDLQPPPLRPGAGCRDRAGNSRAPLRDRAR